MFDYSENLLLRSILESFIFDEQALLQLAGDELDRGEMIDSAKRCLDKLTLQVQPTITPSIH